MRKFGFAVVATAVAAGLLARPDAAAAVQGQVSVAVKETTLQVRRALLKLPYYGVFDFLAFSVDKGTVTLTGFAYAGNLREEAEDMVRRVSGVDEVANRIEVLPTSQLDDQIRWATFIRIYTDDFLSRYSPGGPMSARYEVANMLRFPGMQPFGTYPIHIIVKNRQVTLVGIVDNEGDKTLAGVRAREVSSTAGVTNELMVVKGR
jgi:hyperosmotically inducible protein